MNTKPKGWMALAIVVGVLMGGCKPTEKSDNTGEARLLHAVLDAEALDVVVGDQSKATGLALGGITGYVEVPKGSQTTSIKSSTNGALLLEKAVTYTEKAQTLAIYGKRSAMQTAVLADEVSDPASGKHKVRAVGLSPDAGAVDLYVTGADLSTVPANISGIGYASSTDFIELSEGEARFAFTAAGTKDVLYESSTQRFSAGGKTTLVVFPSTGGKLVNAMQLAAGSGAGAALLANTRSRVKAVNANPASVGYNFFASGSTLLSNVPYRSASSYVTTAAGAGTIRIEAPNVPGSSVASTSLTLAAAQDYTLLAVSDGGTIRLVTLADNNTLPTGGKAKVRFVNALAGSTAVDALVDFASRAAGIPPHSASGYVEFVAGDAYNVTFTTPGGVSTIAALSSVQWVSSGVYTMYVLGNPGGSVEVRLVRDR